jgi:hypothetical protein
MREVVSDRLQVGTDAGRPHQLRALLELAGTDAALRVGAGNTTRGSLARLIGNEQEGAIGAPSRVALGRHAERLGTTSRAVCWQK